jgi:hypothetical protein
MSAPTIRYDRPMPTLHLSRLDASEEERVLFDDGSRERFDRVAFALRAVEVVRPAGMTVAVCESKTRLHVDSGRRWGRGPGAAWAIVRVPPTASREAIAMAVSGLGDRAERGPYTLDVLLAQAAERTA